LVPIGGGSSGGTSNPPPVSVVPEPSTWMMMILGFGVIGFALRRRRKAARAADGLQPGVPAGDRSAGR
jgi:hypothetical protein